MELESSAVDGGACAITSANNPKKKKRGPMNLIKVALYMLKNNKSKKKNNIADGNSTSFWKHFVGTVRPLHSQNHQSPPHQLTVAPTSPEHLEVFTPPMSPAPPSVSSVGNMSQYASAVNLHELDHDCDQMDGIQEDQNHDGDHGFNADKDEDDAIDAKAEEFIAQFYQQIKVQNQVYNHRRHKRG
ncbi:hypothetical protein M5689_004384 [Euphorbia peplus]|nr:hypothetical protein M5689_004384 [Euphorbia peplus]